MPMAEEVLAEAGCGWQDIDLFACGTGPGQFTGVRISVAAARGLALATAKPSIGVTHFEVLHAWACGRCLASVEAPRGMAYVQPFDKDGPTGPARLIDPDAPPRDLQQETGMHVVGFAASRIAVHFEASSDNFAIHEGRFLEFEEEDFCHLFAQVAVQKFHRGVPRSRPTPLYVRAPDAAPPRHAPPAIVP